ncbi:hypothetical protein GOP47_0000886 [Adiantum capillus-veneris]|uniref:Uncharacterized protein n=1 Tax=Adiantum capillus-veneris TaxID=13818 RepID=A0A9D4VFZ5_ADICA|nr:hypothetical protein GOP47_0000886 [Adiantum capillus-veneris]
MDRVNVATTFLHERAVVGRVSGTSLSKASLIDFLQTTLETNQGKVVEVTCLGRGIFMAQLSDQASVTMLCMRVPIVFGGRAFYIMPWYLQFTEDEFKSR